MNPYLVLYNFMEATKPRTCGDEPNSRGEIYDYGDKTPHMRG